MDEDECVQSTLAMLDEIEADGTDDEKMQAAHLVASLSYGWPQHLHCAQMALCRELKDVGGVMKEADTHRVRDESDRRRVDCYRNRLEGSVLGLRPGLTASVVNRVAREKPADWIALADLCEEEIERSGLNDNPNFNCTFGEFATGLVENGVLTTKGDTYEVAIPSMARWLAVSWRPRLTTVIAGYELFSVQPRQIEVVVVQQFRFSTGQLVQQR